MHPHALERTEVDQDIDQRVEVGDRGAVAQLGALNAEVRGLCIERLFCPSRSPLTSCLQRNQ